MTVKVTRSRGGVVVRAPASYHCRLGLIADSGIICGLSLLLVLSVLQEGFLQVLRFPLSSKTNTSKFQLDLESVPSWYSHAEYL